MTETSTSDAAHGEGATLRGPRAIGRYQVSRLIGEGAMGRVYLASDPELERDVAVKVLRRDTVNAGKDPFVARFRNEARAAARFQHPNVVAVYDSGHDPALGPFVVYEFVPGTSLRPAVDAGPLEGDTLVRVAKGVASALDALHAMGIVHRDIKPDNILLGNDGAVKLTDLGIARVPDAALTREGQFLGTPAYAPPEALTRGDYTPRGDVFSLAAVLYEALTGARPFPGESAVKVSYAVVHDTVRPPSSAVPGLPSAVDAVFDRGLAKRPRERYATATELADALALALRPPRAPRSSLAPSPLGTLTPARRPQHPRRGSQPPRATSKHAPSWGPKALAALVLVGLLVVVARSFGRGEEPPPQPAPTTARAPSPAPTTVRSASPSPAERPRAVAGRARRVLATNGERRRH